MNDDTTRWEDVGDKRAAEKVSQTLREKDRDEKAEYLARKSVAVAAQAAVEAVSEEMAHARVLHVEIPSPERVNI